MIGGRGRSGGKAEPPAPTVADRIAWATQENPFVNSLGMKFVPVSGTEVLFSIWETRVRDWEAFLKESGYAWREKPGFEQTPDHPVVKVGWDDAKAFCAWLSKKEGREYRLPTDDEWSVAVGTDKYPWGDEWPPPPDAGNFVGYDGHTVALLTLESGQVRARRDSDIPRARTLSAA